MEEITGHNNQRMHVFVVIQNFPLFEILHKFYFPFEYCKIY